MSRKMSKKFYIGLDIGTDSVGWAVTDEKYELLKARGKDLWGSYLFEEAQTSAERRSFRTTARRYARTRKRLLLLQSLFAEEIAKVDPLFFIRLNNSALFMEDKDGRLKTSDALFADSGFTDKEYFKKYPTIFHLRANLTEKPAEDIRLLYLALHHILKNRGHFLFEGQSFETDDQNSVLDVFYKINAFLEDEDFSALSLERVDEVADILRDRKASKTEKQKRLQAAFGVVKNKQQTAMVKAMVGMQVKVKELFALEDDADEVKSFSFDAEKFEMSDYPALVRVLGEDRVQLVDYLKAVYDWSVLCTVMEGEKFISAAKVKVYEKHKADLRWLKEYVRSHCPEKYKSVFRYDSKTNNYAAYIGMDKNKRCKKCKADDFYKFLKKELSISDEKILKDIENGTFLPRQIGVSNGIVPYQVHLSELKAILACSEEKYPFLKERDGQYTVSQKIEKLLTFRIPYYVGPLHHYIGSLHPNSWAVRRSGYENVSVTPWNFDEAIDKNESENEFIRRMTNKCTYLVGQDVLPACSLLYSEFVFLNELNNLRVNGERNERVRKLIFEYAREHKKVTLKGVLKFLISRGELPQGSKAEEVFSGIDGDFKSSLSSWCDLKFLGDKRETHRAMCEEILLWITLISDKDRLEERIRRKYGEILSEEDIKKLKGLNYSKWGRLSEKLLNGITCAEVADENGETLTIIQAMRVNGKNFMELLSDKYGFKRAIDAENADMGDSDEKVTYDTVKKLYCSPSVKRSIWRSIELVREIIGICGGVPERIFVETAREVNDGARRGERTVSRKQQLLDLYKSIKDEERDWVSEIENTPDSQFNSDKLVMYYQQLGRSMYSGVPIRLQDVFNTNICDRDHIYPQAKIKDDSLNNRVLVLKTENAKKTDEYPISEQVRSKMCGFWNELRNKNLISDIKYARLTRSQPLTRDELTDFINRQLVSTRQSTKAVCEILQKMLPQTKIVYAKAGNANNFKAKYKILKVRELNDLHHAKDAYINIVVGNVYYTKFNCNAAAYFKNNELNSYNLKNLFQKDIPNAWRKDDVGRIKNIAAKNTCRIVRMTERGKGALFNATIKKAGANDHLIPLKRKGKISDTNKYGGYDSATTAYFMLVRSKGKKGKILLSLEAFPLYLEKIGEGSAEGKLRFCREKLGLIEPEILIPEIKLKTLFCIDGSYAYICGKSDKNILWCNANELFLEDGAAAILKKVAKFMEMRKKLNKPDLAVGGDLSAEEMVSLYDALLEKLGSPIYAGLNIKGQLPKLQEKRPVFVSLSREEQCTVAMEVLHLMQCNRVLSNFSLLGGVSKAGVICTSTNIQDISSIKMILQSPTGHYRKVIDLRQYL